MKITSCRPYVRKKKKSKKDEGKFRVKKVGRIVGFDPSFFLGDLFTTSIYYFFKWAYILQL